MVATKPKPKRDRAAYMRAYRQRIRDAAQGPHIELAGPGADVGATVAAWAAQTLLVPSGPLRGQPFALGGWQQDFLSAATAEGVREAGLSVARKNGKSGLIAALLLAYLCGPLNAPQWRGIVVSLTGGLAAELRDAIAATADISGLAGLLTVRRSPPPGSIEGVDGARLTILASDKATGHALGADLAVIDEAGLIQESLRDLWGAVLSSTSGRDGRLLAISIRGDGPMFSEMAARAETAAVHWTEFAAPDDCALDDESAWEAANPGLADGIKSRGYMRDSSAKAIQIPADAASFRAYDLNQPRRPSDEMLCQVDEWVACETETLPDRAGPCVVGFDIGGSSSLTALAVFWPDTGRLEAWAACGDTPDLLERSRADGVGDVYVRMADRGELTTYPGRVTPAPLFLADCAARLEGERVIAAGADRYRRAEVTDALNAAGIRWPMEWRGQGASATADGSHDIRAMQRLVISNRLRVPVSLVLRSAIQESVIRRDSAGNPALDKRRVKGRIDALSAAVIAAGLGEMAAAAPKRRGYLGSV